MHSRLTEIVELCETVWGDVEKGNSGILLHLFVATLHSIGLALSYILEHLSIKEISVVVLFLAESEQDAHAILMVFGNGIFKYITFEIAPTAGGIAQAYP